MNLHFIAIGGSIMHSLAISLKQQGHQISGSDDRVYDPARSHLSAHGLLPSEEGWFPERITESLDAVILGMHAFEDNPELERARELGVPIYSFPEFFYQQCKNKQRIVIAGSYGKTTITAMVMHVLQKAGKKFDYLVGARVPGFDNPVRLTPDAPMFIAEGDEYLASRIDLRPKFLLYQPHIAVVTGISWDHINVFPTEMDYLDAFDALIGALPKAGTIIYNKEDKVVESLVKAYADDSRYVETFTTPTYKVKDGAFRIKFKGQRYPMSVIGKHNMTNIAAASEVCRLLGVDTEEFLTAMGSFQGASSRLEQVRVGDKLLVLKDYAHAPIKVKATVEAVREMYPEANLIACAELHTFSSLNKDYLANYDGALSQANRRVVFINQETVERKRMEPISEEEVKQAFNDPAVKYVRNSSMLPEEIHAQLSSDKDQVNVVLMMSSGDFGGVDLSALG